MPKKKVTPPPPPPPVQRQSSQFEDAFRGLVAEVTKLEQWIEDRKFRADWPLDMEVAVSTRIFADLQEARANAESRLDAYSEHFDALDDEIDDLRTTIREQEDAIRDAETAGRREGLREATNLVLGAAAHYERTDPMREALESVAADIEVLP